MNVATERNENALAARAENIGDSKKRAIGLYDTASADAFVNGTCLRQRHSADAEAQAPYEHRRVLIIR